MQGRGSYRQSDQVGIEQLVSLGAPHDQAEALCSLFTTIDEARPYISSSPTGVWKEYYSLRYNRYYYCHSETGESSWDVPPQLQLRDWMLDASMYGTSVAVACQLGVALLALMAHRWDEHEARMQALELLARITGNIASCGNTVEKYRTVRVSNSKVAESLAWFPGVLDILDAAGWDTRGARAGAGAHATGLLLFPTPQDPRPQTPASSPQPTTSPPPANATTSNTHSEHAHTAPSPSANTMQRPSLPAVDPQDRGPDASNTTTPLNGNSELASVQVAQGSCPVNSPTGNGSTELISAQGIDDIARALGAASLEPSGREGAGRLLRCQLAAGKLASLAQRRGFTGSAVQVDDLSASGANAGRPGFRYQKEIFECGVCSKAINDGSERVFTRSHTAPKGEFRYECEVCPPKSFHLCETCWDSHLGGTLLHPPGHTFRTHHPKQSQHHMYGAETESNPWGVFLGGGSAARARDRLKKRTGL